MQAGRILLVDKGGSLPDDLPLVGGPLREFVTELRLTPGLERCAADVHTLIHREVRRAHTTTTRSSVSRPVETILQSSSPGGRAT